MVLPLLVGGYLLARDSDSGNTDEIMKQVGFNHPEKYKQIHEGKGTGQLAASVQGWKSGIGADFDEVARLLDDANSKAGVAWSGQAAEEHGSSLKPMSQFILDAKNVSESVGDSAEQQVQNFGTVKNSMPEPPKVDATDNLLEKGGAFLVGGETDLQKQERQATEKAQEAKQYYDNYNDSAQNVSQNLAYYPKAPQMAYEQGGGGTGSGSTVGGMANASGIPGGGSSTGGGSGSSGSGLGSGGSAGSGDYGSSTPSQSGSQWASTPNGPTPGMPGGPGMTPPSTSGGTTAFSGTLMPPGGGAGAGAGAGGARGGAGAGAGRGVGAGAGGRAGLGGLGGGAGAGSGGAAGAGGRGGAGMGAGGAAGRGQGQNGDEDMEHEDKYWVDNDEIWDDLGLPKVAPPVFGE